MKVKRMLWGAYLVPLALAVDRVTKVWARKADLPREVLPGILRFTYVKNTGAAFSAFSGKTAWVTAVSVILVLLVLGYLAFGKNVHKCTRLGLWLIVAGGLGNLYDRLALGYVVDFIEVLFVRFAIFNFADICVCCGAVLAAVGFILAEKREKEGNGVGGAN